MKYDYPTMVFNKKEQDIYMLLNGQEEKADFYLLQSLNLARCDAKTRLDHIVKVMGPKTDFNVEQVMNGFDKACMDHNLNVLASCNCDEWKPEIAYEFINNNIDTVKEAEAIMCGNDALAGEVIHALAERGLSRKIFTVGQDADLEACQRIVEGTQLMTVYKPVERLAVLAAECTVKLAKGQPLENVSKFNDGKHEIPYIAIEPVGVFKENIDEIIINSGFHQHDEVYMNVTGSKK